MVTLHPGAGRGAGAKTLETASRFLLGSGRPPGRLGGAAPYLTKPLSCVDCTAVGTTARPEFWIE